MNPRKIIPFIPVLGIPLTFYYHMKYGDTGIEDFAIRTISGVVQGISLFGVLITYF